MGVVSLIAKSVLNEFFPKFYAAGGPPRWMNDLIMDEKTHFQESSMIVFTQLACEGNGRLEPFLSENELSMRFATIPTCVGV